MMIDHNGEFLRIQIIGKLCHRRSPISSACFHFLGSILTPYDIKPVINQHIFILQYGYSVLFQFSDQIISIVSPVIWIIVAFIMISKGKIYAVSSFQFP